MVRSIAIAVACVLATAAPAVGGGLESLDREDGFRGARFGSAVEDLGDLRLLSSRGAAGTQLYVRADEELRYGEASLDGVTYGFFDGELYFVALLTSGKRNADATLAHLERRYGPGQAVEGDAREFVWRGRRVVLHFREDPATAMGMVAITSLPIDARVKSQRGSLPANAAD